LKQASKAVTNRKFRDISAWYHIVVAVDTDTRIQLQVAVKIYFNGVQETSFSLVNNPTQATKCKS
jgi:hypothetical protein